MKNLINFVALVFLLLAVILHSCKKQEIPTLKTATVTNITGTTATSGGWITDEGSGTIVEKGVCWSKGITPAIKDNRTIEGGGGGTFISNMTNLDAATTYYVRAYATNSAGTGYGTAIPFMTMGKAPDASTLAAASITEASATLRGAVNANYLSASVIFEYGPTTSYGQTIAATPGSVTGNSNTEVTADIGALAGGTVYHYRVRAINSLGTTNGEDMSFTTLLSDIDGNVYKVVTIGTQVWMTENLKTTKFNDGTDIPNVPNYRDWALATTTPAYCWWENNIENKDIFGAMYNWYAASVSRLCPAGWHVPSDSEFKILEMFLGMTQSQADTALSNFRGTDQGTKLKSTTGWSDSGNGNNLSGFTGLPAGYRSSGFEELNQMGFWWVSDSRFFRALRYDQTGVFRNRGSAYFGMSVRCIKDN